MDTTSKLSLILERDGPHLLKSWMAEVSASNNGHMVKHDGLAEQGGELLSALRQAIRQGSLEEIQDPNWARVREVLTDISRTHTKQGFTPTEVATLLLAIKRPLFQALEKETGRDAEALAKEVWNITVLVD